MALGWLVKAVGGTTGVFVGRMLGYGISHAPWTHLLQLTRVHYDEAVEGLASEDLGRAASIVERGVGALQGHCLVLGAPT